MVTAAALPQEIVANVFLGERLREGQDGVYEALGVTVTQEFRHEGVPEGTRGVRLDVRRGRAGRPVAGGVRGRPARGSPLTDRPTAASLLDVRTPAEPTFSPDGSRVAFALHATVADVGSFVPSDLY